MKRGILCFALAAALALPTFAAAADLTGVYITPKFLVGIQNSGEFSKTNIPGGFFSQHSQAVFGGALAAGYNFAPRFNVPIRAEIEYALRSNSYNEKGGVLGGGLWASKHTLNISTLFFNAYFDIETGTPLTPYVGGGIGMAFNYTGVSGAIPTERFYVDQYDTTFAWNLGLGVAYAFTESVAADIGYRFVSAGEREVSRWGMKLSSTPYINEFYAGARFSF